jgi:hypothetical protein
MRRNDPNDRAFRVKFINEGGTDVGGLYRELFDSVCAELMSTDLPLLVKTANGQHKRGD